MEGGCGRVYAAGAPAMQRRVPGVAQGLVALVWGLQCSTAFDHSVSGMSSVLEHGAVMGWVVQRICVDMRASAALLIWSQD